MRTVEYRHWAPAASPLSVEFPAELLLELGWAQTSGTLFGSRRGREIRVLAFNAAGDDGQENVGVFVSRIRGEVFLTETDLAFLNERRADLALVVAGKRAGFFVRESDGSIQTVRSHEEFAVAEARPLPVSNRPNRRKWLPAGVVALGTLPLAALAVLPRPKPQNLDVSEIGNQLRISWTPVRNAVLSIDDAGGRVSIPVYADQSTVTYEMNGADVAVSLTSVDASNHLRRESARYVATSEYQGAK